MKRGHTKRSPAARDGHVAIRLHNRDAILRAAHDLFAEFGYEGVSTRAIMARAGLGLGTFYNHFKDKEELFRVLLERHVAAEIPKQHAVRSAARSFPELVERHFRLFFQEIYEDSTAFEMFRRNAAVIREIAASPAHVHGLAVLRDDLETAIRNGLLAPLNVDFLAAAVVGLSLELGALVVQRRLPNPQEAAEFATRLMLRGLPWKGDAIRQPPYAVRRSRAPRVP